jgi:hypothetical protein
MKIIPAIVLTIAIIVLPAFIVWGIVDVIKTNDANIARSATQYELCILYEYGVSVEQCREANNGYCTCNK